MASLWTAKIFDKDHLKADQRQILSHSVSDSPSGDGAPLPYDQVLYSNVRAHRSLGAFCVTRGRGLLVSRVLGSVNYTYLSEYILED